MDIEFKRDSDVYNLLKIKETTLHLDDEIETKIKNKLKITYGIMKKNLLLVSHSWHGF